MPPGHSCTHWVPLKDRDRLRRVGAPSKGASGGGTLVILAAPGPDLVRLRLGALHGGLFRPDPPIRWPYLLYTE